MYLPFCPSQGEGGIFSQLPSFPTLALLTPEHAAASSSCPLEVAGIAPPPLPPATPTRAGYPPVLASEPPAVPASPRPLQTALSQPAAAQPGWTSLLPATMRSEQKGIDKKFHLGVALLHEGRI